MKSKLEKMSQLANDFSKPKVTVEKGKVKVKLDWYEPAAKKSFNGFMDNVLAELRAKSKKKNTKKK